jgi:hypothetical protein
MRRWGETFAAPLLAQREAFAPPPLAGRKLRLGVISSFWQDGGPIELIAPLLLALPRASVELYVYADGGGTGTAIRKLQAMAASWQALIDQDDETAAFLMRNDELDALIDLDGPLRRRRLHLLARKAVPLLVSLLDLPEAAPACGFDAVLGDGDTHPVAPATGSVLRVPGVAITLPPELDLLALPYARPEGRTGLTFGTSARRGAIAQPPCGLRSFAVCRDRHSCSAKSAWARRARWTPCWINSPPRA